MKEEYQIEVSHVTKKFKVYLDRAQTMKELVIFSRRRRYEERVVLNDVSFHISKGEAVGLIGHNGCGKSTTLKMLTRIMYPDSGSITVRGRVSSLIELGAGFHPDMSGRENIYINASIFGLSKKEIDDKLQDIIEFSELQDYIDNPVRTYSSGMYMRLAFSVAINVNADILLIDEILAVGDTNFQAKCFAKLQEIRENGTTIVLVSHSMGQIEEICDRTIWIHDGKVVLDGPAFEVDAKYLEYMEQKREADEAAAEVLRAAEEARLAEEARKAEEERRAAEEAARKHHAAVVTGVRLMDAAGRETAQIESGSACSIHVAYHVRRPYENAAFGLAIWREDGVLCFGSNTEGTGIDRFRMEEDGTFSFDIERLDLVPGTYWIDICLEAEDGTPADYESRAVTFTVISTHPESGIYRVPGEWEV